MRLPQGINALLAKMFTRVPLVGRLWGKLANIEIETDVPWAPMRRPLQECRVCLITTGGLHLRTDKPFDMDDPEGDPTYRVIPIDACAQNLTITHNYYDHRDADRDFNIVLPLDRVRELVAAGHIGGMTRRHFSFMGHIEGPQLGALKQRILPRLLADLTTEEPDFVFLTPA
jgi:D-proline reductase (dithiol) PrdB